MKWLAIGTVGLIIFLIAFTNAIGYVGNALTDPVNAPIWWIIFAVVASVSAIIEVWKMKEE